jgi:hypothetical protein
MVILTTFLAPPMLQWALKDDGAGGSPDVTDPEPDQAIALVD